MMAELTPPGFDNMVSPIPRYYRRRLSDIFELNFQFFGLFGLSNRASSMIGPNVIQSIINQSGNNWSGFPFLFALCTLASLVIWFYVDVEQGRKDAVAWAEETKRASD